MFFMILFGTYKIWVHIKPQDRFLLKKVRKKTKDKVPKEVENGIECTVANPSFFYLKGDKTILVLLRN